MRPKDLTRIFAAAWLMSAAGFIPPSEPSRYLMSVAMAEGAAPRVGDVLHEAGFHEITNPGLYGLGPAPSGNLYAIVAGLLARIDSKSHKILSILREQAEILD